MAWTLEQIAAAIPQLNNPMSVTQIVARWDIVHVALLGAGTIDKEYTLSFGGSKSTFTGKQKSFSFGAGAGAHVSDGDTNHTYSYTFGDSRIKQPLFGSLFGCTVRT